MNNTAQNILKTAERMIREGGYHSFSFRQIADELEIKSSSIHYHFPSKEDLVVTVTKIYTENFLNALGRPDSKKNPITVYINTFKGAYKTKERTCMCGVLAAEAGQLPQSVIDSLEEFAKTNIRWLEKALDHTQPEWPRKKVSEAANVIFSALEGAIIFSAMSQDMSYLTKVGKNLQALIS